MENRLELKHLSCYLPYGLKYKATEYNYNNVIDTLYSLKTLSSSDEFGVDGYTSNWIKPILRPLSDLKKEIEVNGVRFVPLVELFGSWAILSGNVDVMSKVDLNSRSFNTTQKLLELHFDVFGLIEKGLAIDINTLN